MELTFAITFYRRIGRPLIEDCENGKNRFTSTINAEISTKSWSCIEARLCDTAYLNVLVEFMLARDFQDQYLFSSLANN